MPNFCLTVGIVVAGVRLISWLAAEAGERQRDRRAGRQGRGLRCRRGAQQCSGRRLALRAPAWEHMRWAYIYVTLLDQGEATAPLLPTYSSASVSEQQQQPPANGKTGFPSGRTTAVRPVNRVRWGKVTGERRARHQKPDCRGVPTDGPS